MNPYKIDGPAVISFSGGRTSGYLLKHVIDAHGGTLPADVVVCFANTGKERPETLDFVQRCGQEWDVPIVWLEYAAGEPYHTRIVNHNSASRNGEPFDAVIRAKQLLPNPMMRFCSVEMKTLRIQAYARHWLGWTEWTSVIGLRADEERRVAGQQKRQGTGGTFKVMPLHTADVAKHDVVAWWRRQPFDLTLESRNGETLLGNCDLCFMKGKTKILRIMAEDPGAADWWIGREEQAEALNKTRRPSAARFRMDRPSYADMKRTIETHAALRDEVARARAIRDEDDGSVDCACTD